MLGLGLCSAGGVMAVEADSLFLSVGQLFQLGIENSLHIQADRLSELQAEEQSRTARTSRLPDLQLGLSGAYVGQPIVFQRGLSQPSRPETPDWSQSYALDFTQPVYQGGRIRRSIRKADIEKQIALLQT